MSNSLHVSSTFTDEKATALYGIMIDISNASRTFAKARSDYYKFWNVIIFLEMRGNSKSYLKLGGVYAK